MRLPVALQLLPYLFGLPRFRFNQSLFDELIREAPDGKKIVASDKEPEVDFGMGPPSNVLGTYDPKSKRITIEVLSNYLECLTKGDADLRKRFDERMTATLAHEGGHWQLATRHGIAPMIEKLVMHAAFIFLGMFLVVHSFSVSYRLFKNLVGMHWNGAHWVLPTLETIGFVLVFWFLAKIFLEFWNAFAFSLTYKLCYHERYARSFEKRPETDKRWDNVITLP